MRLAIFQIFVLMLLLSFPSHATWWHECLRRVWSLVPGNLVTEPSLAEQSLLAARRKQEAAVVEDIVKHFGTEKSVTLPMFLELQPYWFPQLSTSSNRTVKRIGAQWLELDTFPPRKLNAKVNSRITFSHLARGNYESKERNKILVSFNTPADPKYGQAISDALFETEFRPPKIWKTVEGDVWRYWMEFPTHLIYLRQFREAFPLIEEWLVEASQSKPSAALPVLFQEAIDFNSVPESVRPMIEDRPELFPISSSLELYGKFKQEQSIHSHLVPDLFSREKTGKEPLKIVEEPDPSSSNRHRWVSYREFHGGTTVETDYETPDPHHPKGELRIRIALPENQGKTAESLLTEIENLAEEKGLSGVHVRHTPKFKRPEVLGWNHSLGEPVTIWDIPIDAPGTKDFLKTVFEKIKK